MSEYTHRGTHPDADQLSAFAEGVLPEHERLACMDHLAACWQCREIVYLIQPELAQADAGENPGPAVVPARVPFWKRWGVPVAALSAVGAAVVLLISITAKRQQTVLAPPQPELMAKVEEAPRNDVPATPAPQPDPAQPRRKAVSPVPAATRLQRSQPVSPAPPLTAPAGPVPNPAPANAAPQLAALPAPSELAGVSGKVTDATGAAIPRAQVNLTDASKSKTFTSATDGRGMYSVDGVPPGQYQLKIQSMGFRSAENEIYLQPQQVAKADSVLQVGNVSEAITVTAEAAPVQTSPAARGSGSRGGGGGGGRGAVTFASGLASAKIAATPQPPPELPHELPSGLPHELPHNQPVQPTVTNGKTVLSVDSNGALFISTTSGKTRKPVKGKWHGKVVRLVSPAAAPGANGAIFQLDTDSGEIWFSRDGSHWNPAVKH